MPICTETLITQKSKFLFRYFSQRKPRKKKKKKMASLLFGISVLFLGIVVVLQLQEQSSSAIILSLKKRHGSSGNQYSSSRPSAGFPGNKSTCSLFLGTWVRDNSYPLYKPADCPAVVEPEFDCQMYGRPDSDYLKYRWQPQNCNLPMYFTYLLTPSSSCPKFSG